jgi:DNA-binding transcriptional LysR family regulator
VDLVFRELNVEDILVALRKGTVHAGLAAVFSVESIPGLTVQAIRDRVPTVMIASSEHKRWGWEKRQRTSEITLGDVAEETLCVIEADLYRVLSGLPRPAKGWSRILVQNYATVAELVRSGVAVGFIPRLTRGEELNHPAYEGLEVFRIKDKIPPRTLSILRRSGEDLPEVVEVFLGVALQKLR